jgi:hypothetical protein
MGGVDVPALGAPREMPGCTVISLLDKPRCLTINQIGLYESEVWVLTSLNVEVTAAV